MSRIRSAIVDYACAVERKSSRGSDALWLIACILACGVIGVGFAMGVTP
jgi:hypothetical protein